MPEHDHLLDLLRERAKSFHRLTGVSQNTLSKHLGMESCNYNAFLSGSKSIGAVKLSALLQVLGMSRHQVMETFRVKPQATIAHLQSYKPVPSLFQLANPTPSYDGWTPGAKGADGTDRDGSIENPRANGEKTGWTWADSASSRCPISSPKVARAWQRKRSKQFL